MIMRHVSAALAAILLTAAAASAHSVWIIPDQADPLKATVVYSDDLSPDKGEYLDKIAPMKFFFNSGTGKDIPLAASRKDNFLELKVPGKGTVGGVNTYGVVQRGENKPFLLYQCPKLSLVEQAQPWAHLPLEMIAVRKKGTLRVQVLFKGKPIAAGAEIGVLAPGAKKSAKVATDDKGGADIEAGKPGLYALSVRHTVVDSGELAGKKYEEVRYSASLVLRVAEESGANANPAATKLLDEARQARAVWTNFPGFTADILVQIDGVSSKGKLVVTPDFKFKLEGLDKDAEAWANRELTSVVGHRRDETGSATPACAFDQAAGDSPLGQAIRVVDDKFESAYRIRDRQMMVVQRVMPKTRFTILTLENVKNAEGKFLPGNHVVQHWDRATNALVRSDANSHTWTRVGSFDLPATALKISTLPGEAGSKVGPTTQKLTLTNQRLLEPAPSK